VEPDHDRIRVLAVGAGSTEPNAATGRADDLLGALASLADAEVDVVVVLGDLPDASAADAVRSIRDRSPLTPVIAVAEPDEADRLREAGAADVVGATSDAGLIDRAVRCAATEGRLRARIRELEARLTGLEAGDDEVPA
jgi:DNA-binding NarL/FixJ family response regulator